VTNKNFLRRSLAPISSEDGSAIIEFIVLALPLFVPLMWFVSTATHDSLTHYDLSTYARNLARAYVTAPSTAFLDGRLSRVSEEYKSSLFLRDHLSAFPTFEISCNKNDCLSAGTRVEVRVNYLLNNSALMNSIAAVDYVDQWGGA
jgi:hypothetical protein